MITRSFLFFLLFPLLLSAQNDLLHPDFGANGVVKFERGYSSSIRSMKPLPDGRIMLFAFWSDSAFQIRLQSNGQLDSSFGVNGVLHDFYPKLSLPIDLAGLPNGQYLALRQYQEGTFIPQDGFGITKHHLNGDLDTTFGQGGRTHIILGNYAIPSAMAVQNDGKIIALGFRTGQVGVLARFYPDGQIDSTFDGNGIALAHIDFPYALSALPDGRFLCAGARGGAYPDLKMALARYKENGSLDSSFAVNGRIDTYFGLQTELAGAMLVRPNGKIVLGGWMDPLNNKFALVQFNSDGSTDLTFGTNGLVTTSFPYGGNISDLALLPDGKILAFGNAQYVPPGEESPYYSIIARYTEQGALDASFEEQGIFRFLVGAASSAYIQTVYADNSFVFGGEYYPVLPGPPHFYVARTASITASVAFDPKDAAPVRVYPNPVTDQVVFQLPGESGVTGVQIRLYYSDGQQIDANIENLASGQLIWRRTDRLPGTCFYQIITPDRVFTGKVICTGN